MPKPLRRTSSKQPSKPKRPIRNRASGADKASTSSRRDAQTADAARPSAISPSLKLPDGYQTFNPKWFTGRKKNPYGVVLDQSLSRMEKDLADHAEDTLYLYTQHEIFWEDDVVKQTRSSPNWEGGMVTYATCKHQMRTWNSLEDWVGMWIAGLNPSAMDNSLLFAGQVAQSFSSNYLLRSHLKKEHPDVYAHKNADINPRGDLYRPRRKLKGAERWDHENFHEPKHPHTRSVETYKKSPGSRPGEVPKWWRDHEYELHGKHPPVFILEPCYLFPRPSMVCNDLEPRRAVLKLTLEEFLADLAEL